MTTAPRVTAKAVPFHHVEGQLLIALTASTDEMSPVWQLPETPVYNVHTSLQSLEHMLRTQCGLTSRNVRYREQLYTFEWQDSPTSNALCLTYVYLSSEVVWHKGDQHIGLFPIDRLPDMTEADRSIITYALERLQSKALYTTLPAFLLPAAFSLAAYQHVFETLTGRAVDKRNFRKKLLSLGIFAPVSPPANTKRGDTRLYRLCHNDLVVLPKQF